MSVKFVLKKNVDCVVYCHDIKCAYTFLSTCTLCSQKFFLLFLPEPPSFYNKSADQSVEEGNSVSLFCFATGDPAPVINWFFHHKNGDVTCTLNVLRVVACTYTYIIMLSYGLSVLGLSFDKMIYIKLM